MKTSLTALLTGLCSAWLVTGCFKNQGQSPLQTNVSNKKKLHLAIFGDSLAAGLLADKKVGTLLSAEDATFFITHGMNIWSTFGEFSEADRHDDDGIKARTQTTKFRIVDDRFSRPDLSIFAGNQPYSFQPRIEKKLYADLTVQQFSVSGARTNTLGLQVDEMEIGYKPKSHTPMKKADIIVVHVGGNDWCDVRPQLDFRKDLETNLIRILKLNPTAKVLVFPVSDLISVLKAKDTIAFKTKLFSKKCTEMRELHQVCAKRGIKMGDKESAVEKHRKELADFNGIVEDIVKKLPSKVPTFIGKIDIATEYAQSFSKGQQHEEFKSEWLAIDCFHPGPDGEQVIGEIAWKSMDRFLTTNPF